MLTISNNMFCDYKKGILKISKKVYRKQETFKKSSGRQHYVGWVEGIFTYQEVIPELHMLKPVITTRDHVQEKEPLSSDPKLALSG